MNRINRIRKFATAALCAGCLIVVSVPTPAANAGSLEIIGYQAVTNVSFVDPAQPGFLQVRWAGSGGLAHLGGIRSKTVDQQVNLATGELTSTVTFTDDNGDHLVMFGSGPSALQPDGRVTFAGNITVLGGTGRFGRARGTMTFEGWSRTTDPATGQGIGFFTVSGELSGTKIKPAKEISQRTSGNAVFSGVDFTFTGRGQASRIGKFKSEVHSTQGPFNSAFVGLIDGKFVIASSFDTVWTFSNCDSLRYHGIEFLHFEMIVLPDGSVAPDFTKQSTAEVFATVVGGTGRFDDTEGVTFDAAVFVPTSPTTVFGQLHGNGFLSR